MENLASPSPRPARKTSIRFVDTWASVHLDLLRWVAAVLVLLDHFRNLFFVDFPSLTVHRNWMILPYGLSSAGHQSVVCFFVLSGYFIGGSVFSSVARNKWQWGGYLLRRFVRLWIVLLPTLLLCLLWDKLGMYLGHAPALYAGQVENHLLPNIASVISPSIFFGNLLFVQTILTPVFGSDGALWSLAYEFWYYILFPLAFIAISRHAKVSQRIVCGALGLVVAWFVRGPILVSFPMWLAGAALVKWKPPVFSASTGRVVRIAATLIYFPIFFGIGRIHVASGVWNDYLLTLATVLYVWLLLSHREPFRPGAIAVEASREGARFSYTLYAAHTPVLVLLTSLIVGDSRWYPSVRTLLFGLGLLVAVLAYAWVLAFLTEFRTDAVRGRIEKILRMQGPPSELPSNPLPLHHEADPALAQRL